MPSNRWFNPSRRRVVIPRPLRNSTMLADEYWELCPSCGWDANDNWFDRSICPEPCWSMHTRCCNCGFALDDCCYEAAS